VAVTSEVVESADGNAGGGANTTRGTTHSEMLLHIVAQAVGVIRNASTELFVGGVIMFGLAREAKL